MSISTITISAVDYTAYASVAEADAYLAVDASRAATWATKATDEKGALLVQATRRLDFLDFGGTKTGGDSQENAFPRTGLTYSSGGSVSTSEVPKGIENATILLAGSIALDATAGEAGTSGSNVKKVGAGSAAVEFFRATTGVAVADETSYALVKQFLGGVGSEGVTAGNYASGTSAVSSFSDLDQWGRTIGFP